MDDIQEERDLFLESIANEYGLLGSHREIFLERYSYKNRCCQNNEIARYIGKTEKNLQDSLAAIHKIIEKKESKVKGKLIKKGPGRRAKGEEPWSKLFYFLWEEKFPNYCKNINQDTKIYQELTIQAFRRMLEDKIIKLTPNFLANINPPIPLGLVECNDKPRHSEVKPEHGSDLYRPNSHEIARNFTSEEFLDEVLSKGNSPKSQGKRLAIIGEPGSGKTTRLQQIARWLLKQNENNRVIWVSLAELHGKTLKDYLLTDWLENYHELIEVSKSQKEELAEEFNQGNIWLLLDGIDEMGLPGNPLSWVNEQIKGFINHAKIIVTCRLNIWEDNSQAITYFDVYKNNKFSEDQINDYITTVLNDAHKTQELIKSLNQPGKERIKDLVKNPLNIWLICEVWKQHQGQLPNTKAKLYEEYIKYYYKREVKSEVAYRGDELTVSKKKKKELHQALGKLAIQGLERKDFQFRFTEKQINDVLGESDEGLFKEGLFKLALELGLLNPVGLAEETSEEIYAFLYTSFQEYFAALAIDDPDYLLKHIPQNPERGIYKILEPQWLEIALFWIGLPSINNDQKNRLMNQLVYFHYEPKSAWIYQTRALIIATELISEFHDCEIIDTLLDYAISNAFGDWNEENKELIEYPKSQNFIDKIKTCSHPLLLKKLEDKLIFLSKNIPDHSLFGLAKLILEKNTSNTIAQEIVDHFPTWSCERNHTDDDYYQYCGFANHQDFMDQLRQKYGHDYGTDPFWERYEQNKDQYIQKPQKPRKRYIPNSIDCPELFVSDDDSNSWGIDDYDQDDFKSISELINDEIWVSNNALKNQSVIELFEREPSHLFSCAGLNQFLDWAIFGRSNSLMNIIKDNLANFDSDKNYSNHIEDVFIESLSGTSDYIAWQVGDDKAMTTIEGRPNLMYQTLIYDYFCYKYPESRLSMRDYLQTLEQSKFKELYSAVLENVFALAMKTTNLNIFLTIFAFLIDLSNKYGVIKPKLMDEIISRFFEFDINFYISTKIADYLADRINYSEFYQRWRDHNKLSGQMTMNHFF